MPFEFTAVPDGLRSDRLPWPACARGRSLLFALLSVAVLTAAAQPPVGPRDVTGWMARVGERIEQYYARAHSIICEETVRLEPLGFDLLSNGDHVRELVYELRVAWDGATERATPATAPTATVLRELLTVDGRPPRPGDEPGCMDPKPVSPEPLGLLLPHRQGDYVFSWRGQGRERGPHERHAGLQTGARPAARHRLDRELREHRSARPHARPGLARSVDRGRAAVGRGVDRAVRVPRPEGAGAPARAARQLHRRARGFVDRLSTGRLSRSRKRR